MSDINSINDALSDDAPSMPNPLSDEVRLLRGLQVKETGDWHTMAKVRELNGADEEFLAVLGAKDGLSYVDYMTAILDRAVISIGSLPAEGICGKLILADRDMLYLAITKATYGVEKEISVTCGSCGERQNFILDLDDDFPILRPEEDTELQSPLVVRLAKGDCEFRYPTGDDTSYAMGESENTPELNTMMIARTVETDAPLEERLEWARDLGIADRKKVEKAIAASTDDLGPQLGAVDTRCTACKEELPIMMDWVSLLLG